MQAPRKIAFVSGKGGVGKTLLAANFALLASTRRKTVLIDFDFQNQGSSGLLTEYLHPGCVNAFDLLGGRGFEAHALIAVRTGLFFVPSFDPSRSNRMSSQTEIGPATFGLKRLHHVLASVLTTDPFELLVLDCHGGLDDVSFAAFIDSDITFIVTEADKVTFNGTLELLDFYIGRAELLRQDGRKSGVSGAALEEELFRRVADVENNKVRFLVNRVSGKFTYVGLTKILQKQFYANIAVLRAMNEGFSFFPTDPLAAESFSEYPFFVEILPESIFAQKLELLYADTFNERPVVRGRSKLYPIFERMPRRRLKRYLKSPYDVRVQNVFTFVAATQAVFFVLVVLAAVGAVVASSPSSDKSPQVPGTGFFDKGPGGSIVLALISVLYLYLALFDVRVSRFFRDRWRYEVRLLRKGARHLTITLVIRLTRVFLLRLFPLIFGFCFLITGIVLLVIAAGQLLT